MRAFVKALGNFAKIAKIMKKVFLGGRIRRLREELGLTQAALAKRLEISPSYLNQIERNQRPLTVQILLRINQEFGLDIQFFSEEGDARLVAELREAFPQGSGITAEQIRNLVENLPEIARQVISLHRDFKKQEELTHTLTLGGEASGAYPSLTSYEAVRDFFYDNHNFFPEFDQLAEDRFEELKLEIGQQLKGLSQYFSKIGIKIAENESFETGRLRHYDSAARTLYLSKALNEGQKAYQMATQLALLEHEDAINGLLQNSRFTEFTIEGTIKLAKVGLANYFAAALLMPYQQFWKDAEACSYDIEWLGHQYSLGYETICHRLSTLQRPTKRGIPFFFLRVDRAGNISKRQSATDFHFSKIGGSCPLWKVHSAFDHPGEILTQLAEMPDGRQYFWVTRTVTSGHGRYGAPKKTFAIALGCDVQHAHRLIYSKGLDINNPEDATPIGAGCKVCPREACSQRAFPMAGRRLEVNTDLTGFSPYSLPAKK
ncbi:short-chain fatty acyl-CoA regulator family protein [Sneathiella glossodoripedis]|uniref:short-chain fatty acyl-CoA regulator family protein n=1 Tax=Sneathiella glossodoripedis TaxID=418853 RepID=UPI000AA09B8A|nr:short-chain fatty acyl-CoA regulator family protein [Sneathiella glossodoripedis]